MRGGGRERGERDGGEVREGERGRGKGRRRGREGKEGEKERRMIKRNRSSLVVHA